MELYLQFGAGMMEHARQLVSAWGGGTVILSPRDLKSEQLVTMSNKLRKLGGVILVDPQFYLPYADHERLRSHAYWPEDYESSLFWSGVGINHLLTDIFKLNRDLGCQEVILPGLHTATVTEDWLDRQQAIIDEAQRLNAGDAFHLIATVALGEDATSEADQIHDILDAANRWSVDGVYLICEHPRGEYLVTDANWLANVLDLTAGMRLKGKQVILGYSQHQMLIAACAGASAIASGTWLNVRVFPPEKFRLQYGEEFKAAPSTWYYSPLALSEFTLTYLDLAYRQKVLDQLATPAAFGSIYSDALFGGGRPSTMAGSFGQQEAFRHYLQCLHTQVAQARRSTFADTVQAYEETLDEAERILSNVHSAGIRWQSRDFANAIETCHMALQVLQSDRGPLLRRNWSQL